MNVLTTTNRPRSGISLHEAMEVGFDLSQLANHDDAVVHALQLKALSAINDWTKTGGPKGPHEQAWFDDLGRIRDYTTNLLTTRYGCND